MITDTLNKIDKLIDEVLTNTSDYSSFTIRFFTELKKEENTNRFDSYNRQPKIQFINDVLDIIDANNINDVRKFIEIKRLFNELT